MARPNSAEAAVNVARIFASPDGGAGCCLHVQISDGNLEDRFFSDDARAAIVPEHRLCLETFDMLKQMKRTARKKACEKARMGRCA